MQLASATSLVSAFSLSACVLLSGWHVALSGPCGGRINLAILIGEKCWLISAGIGVAVYSSTGWLLAHSYQCVTAIGRRLSASA